MIVIPTADRPSPRIVSLLPSITEILCALGLSSHIVGITHECDHPVALVASGRAKVVTTSDINPRTMTQAEIHAAVCGSLKNGQSLYGIDKEVLRSVMPDVIFTQSLCDVCAVSFPVVIDTCAKLLGGGNAACPLPSKNGGALDPKVISLEPEDLADCLKTFRIAAEALDDPEVIARAKEVTDAISKGFDRIREVVKDRPRPRVAFLEWHDPIFCGGHWIVDMLEIAGGEYAMPIEPRGRSVAMTNEDFASLDPDVVLVGPCGFGLDRTVRDTINILGTKDWWRNLRAVKEGKVYALDGNSFYARPGPRLLQGTGIMSACMHGTDVAAALGQELAPNSGYCQITPIMYERRSLRYFEGALSATPAISACKLRPHPTCSLFVAWNGVIVLAYEGFPPPLALAKERIKMFMPAIAEETFGSKWPKSTLAAVNDEADDMDVDDLRRLRGLCSDYSERIVASDVAMDVAQLSVVEYKARGLESLEERIDINLCGAETDKRASGEQIARVDSVVAEWSDLEAYLPKVNAPGSRIRSYREESSSGTTCVAFLHPLPDSLQEHLKAFREVVDDAFPGRYSWLDEKSIHCTLRSLD